MSIRIGIDLMGGDYAPAAPAQGIASALADLPSYVSLTIYGRSDAVSDALQGAGLNPSDFHIVHTTQVIEMGDSPTKAMNQKADSSIMVGLNDLKAGKIDCYISAGSTGAVFVGALYTVKPIEGILRPAISSLVPKDNGHHGLILDVGANADCKADVLVQFGMLGSIYARCILGVEKPRVGLLNIGSEPEKGNIVSQAAYNLMVHNKSVNFIGNIEGYDIFGTRVDVVVTDGFTGNIVLKTAEALVDMLMSQGVRNELISRFDYQSYGGTPILGVNKPVIIGHGVSSPAAFKSMIGQAIQIIETSMIEKIKQALMPEMIADEKN